MKKYLLISLLLSLLLCTGCDKDSKKNADNSSKKNTINSVQKEENDTKVEKELVCSKKLEDENMVQNITFKFNAKGEAISMDTAVAVDITEYLNGVELTDEMRAELLDTYEEMFSKENGYKNAQVSISGNIVSVELDIFDDTNLKKLYDYKTAKKTFENLNYTCK